jgi:CHAT domain-containing protein
VPPALHAVPWLLVPALAGVPATVAPSATWWCRAGDEPEARPGGRPAVVAGARLNEAEWEARAVAACHDGADLYAGRRATVEAVRAMLGVTPLVHLATHVRARRDNALWSSIELADGPLYVYDLEQERSTPPLAVLSGCETGVGVRAGDDLLGWATSVLERGRRRLVASVCALPDNPATRDVMIDLHTRLAAGARPAEALAGVIADRAGEPSLAVAGALLAIGVH